MEKLSLYWDEAAKQQGKFPLKDIITPKFIVIRILFSSLLSLLKLYLNLILNLGFGNLNLLTLRHSIHLDRYWCCCCMLRSNYSIFIEKRKRIKYKRGYDKSV